MYNKESIKKQKQKQEQKLLKLFPLGVTIESADGKYGGSEVFWGEGKHLQPFSYLVDWNPDNYRIKKVI